MEPAPLSRLFPLRVEFRNGDRSVKLFAKTKLYNIDHQLSGPLSFRPVFLCGGPQQQQADCRVGDRPHCARREVGRHRGLHEMVHFTLERAYVRLLGSSRPQCGHAATSVFLTQSRLAAFKGECLLFAH
jgi:hypothetical protein